MNFNWGAALEFAAVAGGVGLWFGVVMLWGMYTMDRDNFAAWVIGLFVWIVFSVSILIGFTS